MPFEWRMNASENQHVALWQSDPCFLFQLSCYLRKFIVIIIIIVVNNWIISEIGQLYKRIAITFQSFL